MTDSVTRFSNFADFYDHARPSPPTELAEFIRQWIGLEDPAVVDIGAGTGLATALWPRAIGVEPSDEMRAIAEARGLTMVSGSAEATGLPDKCADVVTVSQALHWFDPKLAFPEVVRLLRPGGVLAAFDHDWPPAVDAEVDAAYREFEETHSAIEAARGLRPTFAAKKDHLGRLRESGLFRHVTEVCLHHQDSGDAQRLIDVASSQGGVIALLNGGASEDEIGLTKLRKVAGRRLATPKPWHWTYRIRLASV
ncbi:class I SAM-dependent methyltransferase [Kutzneria buriramensis]|uniref:Methyltransferase family protein n=1 Tax=Kutzneria buriramensis TaxID=1045776 RepID=A0A3E0G7U5_9PSEU|nr:class I SAM-dependent methyltransferase [Kutzneria buriramensis]REH18158.1 methyltransferase family protein [Kutzneria buriramensis]